MKTLPLFLTIAGSIISHALVAQDFAASRRAESPAIYSAEAESTAGAYTGAPVITKPDAKLVANLAALFPAATGQTWRAFNSCYHVSFLLNGEKARAVFSAKARFNYAILDCSKDALPALLKEAIERDYAAYQLLSATQVNAYDAVAHQVVLESGTEIVTLKATVDGVEVVSRVKK